MNARDCFLYVLPLAGEALMKVGISVDPLARAAAFHSRYYEYFELSESLLVGFDTPAEARRRETALHRMLRSWNATQPLAVPGRAGGHTEWFRGAYPLLREEVEQDRMRGHAVHAPATDWWRQRLQRQRADVYEWACQWLRDFPDEETWPAHWRAIADPLDAWPALGLPLDDVLPPRLARWYGRYRGYCSGQGLGFRE